jgi:hypothetical protein
LRRKVAGRFCPPPAVSIPTSGIICLRPMEHSERVVVDEQVVSIPTSGIICLRQPLNAEQISLFCNNWFPSRRAGLSVCDRRPLRLFRHRRPQLHVSIPTSGIICLRLPHLVVRWGLTSVQVPYLALEPGPGALSCPSRASATSSKGSKTGHLVAFWGPLDYPTPVLTPRCGG